MRKMIAQHSTINTHPAPGSSWWCRRAATTLKTVARPARPKSVRRSIFLGAWVQNLHVV